METREQRAANLRTVMHTLAVTVALAETVKEEPEGAPLSSLWMGLGKMVTLEVFNQFIENFRAAGWFAVHGNAVYWIGKDEEIERVRAMLEKFTKLYKEEYQ